MATTYAIHNTARARHTRGVRSTNATHRGMKQYVTTGQHRLIRGRPVIVTEEVLLTNLEELRKKNKAGILEVRTLDGRILNLDTLVPPVATFPPPLPHPPLDSVARDTQNVGNPMQLFPGGESLTTTPDPIAEPKPAAPPIEDEEVVYTEPQPSQQDQTSSRRKGRR